MDVLMQVAGIGTVEIIEASHAFYATEDGRTGYLDTEEFSEVMERPDVQELQEAIHENTLRLLEILKGAIGYREELPVHLPGGWASGKALPVGVSAIPGAEEAGTGEAMLP